MSGTIRQVFSPRRPIDRTIEKVIDYYAQEEDRLAREIDEYEVTDNIESCFRKFLDVFEDGVRGGQVTEVGIWVSGFYGSGKSSFTKYLGATLDRSKTVKGSPVLDLLCERFPRSEIPAALRAVSKKYPTVVVLLDLGAEQLAESAAAPVSTVLYWKVLQWAGFSKEKKTAQLEFTLDRRGNFDDFKQRYKKRYNEEWKQIHNDPLIGVARAAEIVPEVLPNEFPTPESFRSLRFDDARDVRDLVREIIELCRRKTGHENILLLVDEAGQYVAPRGELILNLDGLARNLKELGKGKVWIAATGQQTLSEIVEKAAHNSAELTKLRDRFPISVHLDASDIREITHRRLLDKSEHGLKMLEALFEEHGQSTVTHTRLHGTALFRGDPDPQTFLRLYPFLPQHFDLLLELIRTLARSTGGIGLRSAIRVIQDVLVDKSRVLGTDTVRLADQAIGTLACVDDFYDTLRADIAKVLPHVIGGVEKTSKIFGADSFEMRVAKAVAALQPVETFPRTAENIAALLYRSVGSSSLLDQVQESLHKLSSERECGLIEDPRAGGFVFLSDAVKPIRDKRNAYAPTSGECARARIDVLKQGTADHPMFRVQPAARLENIKDVKSSVKLGRAPIVGGAEDVEIRLELTDPMLWEDKRSEFLISTNAQIELKNTVVLLVGSNETVEELLPEIVRSEKVLGDVDERSADHVVAQYLRAERRAAERYRERVAAEMENAILDGIFIFRGKPTPVREIGEALDSATRNILSTAVKEVFPHFHLAPVRPSTDSAAKFLSVERTDRITKDLDPLGLVIKSRGAPRVDKSVPVLAEVLRVFQSKAAESGSGRLQGSYLQNIFSTPPYGWTKDTVRYLFAALLRAGEIEFHVPGAGGSVRTVGPQAIEAVKSTVSFNRIGISTRDAKLPPEALDRAARRLEALFGDEVLPLEDHISRSVRRYVPDLLERLGALPDRLRLLNLPGEYRCRRLLEDAADLLKGDAGGAAATLGGTECDLPEEITWAKAVFDALEAGAEDDVSNAKLFLNATADLENLFPGATGDLLSPKDRAAAEELLSADRFHERLPELRSVIRAALDRVRNRYNAERSTYAYNLKKAVDALEAEADWPKLLDDDREEIAARLVCDLPDDVQDHEPVRLLQTLLVRKRTLPGLIEELRAEIKRRLPAEPEPEAGDGGEPIEEEVVEAASLVEDTVISTTEDLESLLSAIREKLTGLLHSHKRIRLKGRG
ncbi:MAG: BREX system P-loop protein BrxC [Rhodobacteraceae bacterium]|nr:BREX system P-loop protein BrxC [Paracoccaceae bacterium]